MPIRPTTGRLLQVRTVLPMCGVWMSTMALSATAIGRMAAMSGAFEAGPREIVSNFNYEVHELHICIAQ